MAKITLPDLTSGYYSTATLNQAFADIEEEFDNTVSRDGATPSYMTADLDMNSNDILNVGDISATDITIGGQSLGSIIDEAEASAASAAISAEAATSAAAVVSASSCCLDSATSFFDFGLITDTSALFPTDFGSVV